MFGILYQVLICTRLFVFVPEVCTGVYSACSLHRDHYILYELQIGCFNCKVVILFAWFTSVLHCKNKVVILAKYLVTTVV